jgi:hypothetical protein
MYLTTSTEVYDQSSRNITGKHMLIPTKATGTLDGYVRAVGRQLTILKSNIDLLDRVELDPTAVFPNSRYRSTLIGLKIPEILKASMTNGATDRMNEFSTQFANHVLTELLIWLPLIELKISSQAIETLKTVQLLLIDPSTGNWTNVLENIIQVKGFYSNLNLPRNLRDSLVYSVGTAEEIAEAFIDQYSSTHLSQSTTWASVATSYISVYWAQTLASLDESKQSRARENSRTYIHSRNRAKLLQLILGMVDIANQDTFTQLIFQNQFEGTCTSLLAPLVF